MITDITLQNTHKTRGSYKIEKKNEKVVQKLRGKKEKGVATDAAESQKASLFFLYSRPLCQGEQQQCSKIS